MNLCLSVNEIYLKTDEVTKYFLFPLFQTDTPITDDMGVHISKEVVQYRKKRIYLRALSGYVIHFDIIL